MAKPKAQASAPPSNEVRRLMLQYFYDRNTNATSSKGKKGSAVKISAIKAELKDQHHLTQSEVQRNLTYLLSQGWVCEQEELKQFRSPNGTLHPRSVKYYQITAPGIDKIEGEGEFTMPRFNGIKIEATGQNIITLGDGNKINAQFSELGKALVELREAITKSDAPEVEKMSVVADIDTIQSQLAKPQPRSGIIKEAWDVVKGSAAINGCTALVGKISGLIANCIS